MRHCPARPLPPYAFVPGHWPHPQRDAAGHSVGTPEAQPAPLVPSAWQDAPDYLWGLDLFNHGYYWEAHEAWEGLWIAAGRHGPVAELLQGLIKLAAGALKWRQRQPRAARSLAKAATEHFGAVTAQTGATTLAGLVLAELVDRAQAVAALPEPGRFDPARAVEVVCEPLRPISCAPSGL